MTTPKESFVFRLEAAADVAQSLGTRLLDLAARGSPTPDALTELRGIEGSLDVCSRLFMRDLEKAAAPAPFDEAARKVIGGEASEFIGGTAAGRQS